MDRALALSDLLTGKPVQWVELDPSEATDPEFSTSPIERNDRWGVVVRRVPELDER
jgi:hypothetical protein